MKKLILPLALAVALAGCNSAAKRLDKLDDDSQKSSYSIGYSIGQNFKTQGLEVNLDALVTGLADGLSEKEGILDEKGRQDSLQALQVAMQEKAMKKHEEENKLREEQAKENIVKEEKFLGEYAAKEGITKTASGVMYKVLTAAQGKKPNAKSTVQVHYKGSLADGTVFDSSIERGQPAEFPVNGVIPGWSEAIQLMSVGAKWEVVIPSALAYGPAGAGNRIPPNSPLVFEIELLEIK